MFPKRKGNLSIIIVPGTGGKPWTITLDRRRIWFVLAAVSVVLVLVAFSLVTAGQKGWSALTISQLRRENTRLKEEQGKLTRLEQELRRLRAVEKKLAGMLGLDTAASSAQLPGQAPDAGPSGQAGSSGGTYAGKRSPRGLDPASGATSSGSYSRSLPTLWPVLGEISRTFSYAGDGHRGLDIAVANGTPVRASGDGTVEFAGADDVFGQMVIINHGSGISTLYGHNSKLVVKRGDEVVRGQVIAYSGSSGKSTAPHLHFEVSRYGRQVNPLTFLSER